MAAALVRLSCVTRGRRLTYPAGRVRITGSVHSEERVVPLEPGANLIMLSAFNGAHEIETGVKERPLLALRYDAGANSKPVMRLLAVGVDKYTGKDIPLLANAAADASGVAAVMRGDTPSTTIYADIDAVVLTDADASLANIDKGIHRSREPQPSRTLSFLCSWPGTAWRSTENTITCRRTCRTPRTIRSATTD